jgi:hypothetical protein
MNGGHFEYGNEKITTWVCDPFEKTADNGSGVIFFRREGSLI